jgi:hypothetical protein
MFTRRDFLKGLAGLIVVAPVTALATVQRLGTPQEWALKPYYEFKQYALGFRVSRDLLEDDTYATRIGALWYVQPTPS